MSFIRLRAAAVVLLGAGLLVPLPALSRPGVAAPRGVAARVIEQPVTGIDAVARARLADRGDPWAASGPGRARPRLLSRARRTANFSVVGVTWATDPAIGEDVTVEVRVRHHEGWTAWRALQVNAEEGPDQGSADLGPASRDGTGPLWVGTSDGVQVRMATPAQSNRAAGPVDVRVSLIDPGTSAADAAPTGAAPLGGRAASAAAASDRPAIISRAQWGADESMRDAGDLEYTAPIRAAFVHHTDSVNTYSAAEAPAVIRGIYAFHVRSRGWSDIGYNFLVDRFGRLYEGRYGGVDRPVLGAHTDGFNSATFGVSLVGNYTSIAPGAAQLEALQGVLAWKLGQTHRDPFGRVAMTSVGSSRYPKGRVVDFDVISGHRDASQTACPGEQTYRLLPQIRSEVRRLMGASLVEPHVVSSSMTFGNDGPVDVFARLLVPLTWTLTVSEPCSGRVVTVLTGAGETDLTASWNLRTGAGERAPPGTYRLRLEGSSDSDTATPWIGNVDIAVGSTGPALVPTVPLSQQIPAALVAGTTYHPLTPARILDTRSGVGGVDGALTAGSQLALSVLGVGGVPDSGVSAVVLNVTATCPTAASHLTVFPAGGAPPSTSNLNVVAGQTVATLVVAKVGQGGSVAVSNHRGSVHAIADVIGWYDDAVAATGSRFRGLAPARVLDTRTGTGVGAPGRLPGGATLDLHVPGAGGVPADGVQAVVLNVTAVSPTTTTHLTVYPAGADRPTASSLNAAAGAVVANLVVAKLGTDGSVAIYNAAGTVDVVADVVGYYSASGDRYTAAPPVRLLDTRRDSSGRPPGVVGHGESVDVVVTGRDGVPAAGVSSVMLTVTAVTPTAAGFLTVHPSGVDRPLASTLNFMPGRTVPNLTVVPLGDGGAVRVFNSAGRTHLLVDVVGWFTP